MLSNWRAADGRQKSDARAQGQYSENRFRSCFSTLHGGWPTDFPDIECEEMIVDATCMKLVMDPQQFDVIVTTNLFGDIISDLCAGLVGGLGLAPGANIGKDAAIFEAVHGSAPDIAGQKIANPCALLLASAQMLSHLGMQDRAGRLHAAITASIADADRTTPDLGGSGNVHRDLCRFDY